MKKVRIHLSGREGLAYRRAPVSFGVPFADGEVEAGVPVGLTGANGRAMPVQTQCLATWKSDRKHLKWLLVDTQADVLEDGARDVFLEIPAAEPPPEVEGGIRVQETEETFRIDTGVMRAWFRHTFIEWNNTRNPDVFFRCEVKAKDGWRDLFRGHPGLFLYMKDQHGLEYNSHSAGPAPKVYLEERGPLRTCIRIDGHHATAQGHRFCPYRLRLHFFAGRSDIRIAHTFIFDQEPRDIELAAVGMKIPLDLGTPLRGAIGGEDQAHRASNWQELQVLQEDDRSYRVSRNSEAFGAGGKAGGWAGLNGERGSVSVAMRDFWQEFPKGFALSREGIDVQIWPESCGRNLAFTTPFDEPALRFTGKDGNPIRNEKEVERLLRENPTAPLNLKSFNIRSLEDVVWVEQMVEKYGQGRTITYNDTSTNNGVGAAKTTEIHLLLSADGIGDQEAQAFADTVQEPLLGIVDPEHTCASRALGHTYAGGDARFATTDSHLQHLYDAVVVDPVERCRLYGMMRYGNMVCCHSSAVGWVYQLYKDEEPEKALRYVGPYNDEANDQIMAVWCHAARTGDRGQRIIAQNYSRSVADVAFVHACPDHPERVGLMHYHNGHQWSGGLSPSHSIVTGILTDFFMTGNRRLLDVAREAADRIVATQEPCGILHCHGSLHREFTGPLSILMDLYQATWEEKYGDVAFRSLNWLLRTSPKPGRLPNSVYTRGECGDEAVVHSPCLPEVAWGNKYCLYEAALRLIPSKRLQEFLIAEADYWVWESPKDLLNYQCSTVCLAYDLTGDPSYAAYAEHLVDDCFRSLGQQAREMDHVHFGEQVYNGFIPKLMCIIAQARARDPESFQAACDSYLQRRAKMPDREPETRPDQGSKTSLGRLSTAPHPPV